MIELNKVYNEDCLIGMNSIPNKSVDMILCDLPYGTTSCKWDVVIPFESLWAHYERVIKDNGAIVLTASQPFTSMLVMSNLKIFRCEWIWEKDNASNPSLAKINPMKYHENIVVFAKKAPTYNPQMVDVGRKSNIPSLKPRGLSQSREKSYIFDVNSLTNFRYPKSVQKFNRPKPNNGLSHPTQKPVELFEYLIKTYTKEGETVLDNCMGSGTTAIACINTGRNYIGFEKEEKYYNIIQVRIRNHTPQLKLIA